MNNPSTFSSPQRQSKIGIILLSVINFGKFLKAFLPLLIILILQKKEDYNWIFYAAIGVALVYFVVYSILEYLNFSYFIDTKNQKFVIRKGIINKKEIIINTEKIQEVNINQPFLHKILNIFELEIDSTGTEKKEVKVNAISYHNALEIKNYLLENENVVALQENQSERVDSDDKTLKISLGSLVKYGLTANYLKSFAAIIGFGIYLLNQILDFIKDFSLQEYVPSQPDLEKEFEKNIDGDFPFFLAFGIVTAIFIIGILVNVILNIFKYFGMQIRKKENQMSLQYGLLNSKNAIISKNKVQKITEKQNYLQKQLNILMLKFNQISEDENSKEGKNIVPGCNKAEKTALTEFVWKNFENFHFSLKPNFRKLISRNVVFIFIPIIISIFVRDLLGEYWIVIPFYILIAEALIVFSWLNNRLFYNEDFIRVKSGVWDISKETVRSDKIQAIQLSQFFWQKKTDLGSVHFFTAGGDLSFSSANFSKLKKIVNFALFKVENSATSWM